jgi:hypothetical protein
MLSDVVVRGASTAREPLPVSTTRLRACIHELVSNVIVRHRAPCWSPLLLAVGREQRTGVAENHWKTLSSREPTDIRNLPFSVMALGFLSVTTQSQHVCQVLVGN